MTVFYLITSLFTLSYLALTAYVVIKTTKSILLTRKQKIFNIALSILVPFIWPTLMFYILKKEPNYFDKRKHITNDRLMDVHTSGFFNGTS